MGDVDSLAKWRENEVLKRCFGSCLMQHEARLIGLLIRS